MEGIWLALGLGDSPSGSGPTLLVWLVIGSATLLAAHLVSVLLQQLRIGRIRDKRSKLSAAAAAWGDSDRIPVTIVTGFLGAGKTTLLNALLRCKDSRICVIENEVGSVGLDHDLLRGATEGFAKDVFVLANGCVCCSAGSGGTGGELERVLDLVLDIALATREAGEPPVDHVVIETSGLADPAPLVELFFTAGGADDSTASPSRAFELRGVVTVADAKNILRHLPGDVAAAAGRRTDPADSELSSAWLAGSGAAVEAGRQVAFADRIWLNKVDLVGAEAAAEAERAIARVNPMAELTRCVQAVPLGETREKDGPPTRGQVALLSAARSAWTAPPAAARLAACGHSHGSAKEAAGCEQCAGEAAPHSHSATEARTLRARGAVLRPALEAWLARLVSDGDRWHRLYRIKGAVRLVESDAAPGDDPAWAVIQGVHSEVHVEPWPEGAAPPDDGAGSGFVVLIGRRISDAELAGLQEGLDACMAGL